MLTVRTRAGGCDIPDLIRYQLRDGPHAGEPTTERGEVERLARECETAGCWAGLDSTVVETRFNVVRSPVPDVVTTVRRLRDYLPPQDGHGLPTRAEALGSPRHMALGRLLEGTLRSGWVRPAVGGDHSPHEIKVAL